VAWLALGVIGVWAWTHWPAVKAAWRYRDAIDEASNVLDQLENSGVLK
jgi:hypothetical protein